MIVKKKCSSSSGIKWLNRAKTLAYSLSATAATKREIADGFLVEGKKTGRFRSASVVEIPSTLIMQGHFSISSTVSRTGHYPVASRDIFDPRLANNSVPVGEATNPSRYAMNFGSPPSGSANMVLSSGAISISGEHEQYHCSIMIDAANAHWLSIDSTPMKGEAYGWNYTFSEPVIKSMFPGLGFEYMTDDNDQRLFQPVAIRVNTGEGETLVRTLIILMPLTEIFSFNWPNGRPYKIARHHLTMIRLDLDRLTYSGRVLPINDFLPSWAVPETLKRTISPYGLIDFPADSSIRMTDIMLGKNGNVIASFNYFVRKQTYFNGVKNSREMSLARLGAAGRIEIAGQTLKKAELFDVDVFAWNGSPTNFFPDEPVVSRLFTRTLISVGLLANGDVVTNGMCMDRAVKDLLGRPRLDPIAPYSYLTINGEIAATHANGFGALNTEDTSPISHRHHASAVACSVSCTAVSDTTTAITWYQPQINIGVDQAYGVTLTDGSRFRNMALGRTTDSFAGQEVQFSCPQKEVRDAKGKLICPSTIIACYWDNGVFMSVRKGPIWPEDGAEPDESLYWSTPVSVETSNVVAPYYAGNLYIKNNHGYYFERKEV